MFWPIISISKRSITLGLKRIQHILDVLNEIKTSHDSGHSTSITKLCDDAFATITSKRGLCSPRTVPDACTRQLDLTTPQFNKYVEDWLTHNSMALRNIVLCCTPDQEDKQNISNFFNTSKLNNSSLLEKGWEDTTILEEIKGQESTLESLTKTQRDAVVNSRLGQGKFRKKLIEYWGGCAITEIKLLSVLRASHIKPWRKATNNERLDKYNGLLLVANLDIVFDAGFITFEDNGRIKISNKLSVNDCRVLGIQADMRLSRLEDRHLPYLKHHRDNEYKYR